MSEAHDTLLEAALKLSLSERCSIVEKLIATVPPECELSDPDEAAFLDEMERRANEEVACIPWTAIQAEMFQDPNH